MNEVNATETGRQLHARLTKLYPICRSITGNGVRQTLKELQSVIPLKMVEVPTGTAVYDWVIPDEWNIREAWVKDASGKKIIDFQQHNLHIVNYSTPLRARMTLSELRPHLHSLPEQPYVIPYRTSYYKPSWGFCVQHTLLEQLEEGEYEVCIDTSLGPGSLTYGEFYLPGETSSEILISTHVCHPSLANDNLAGIVVAAELAARIAEFPRRRYGYRFLFTPATIGVIAWLANNTELHRIIAGGLVLSGLGDPGAITYKCSRRGRAMIDRIVGRVLRENDVAHRLEDFSPNGYDERQFCSPGVNLPVGRLSRTTYGTYPQYHTSDDNPTFVTPESLGGALQVLIKVVAELESEVRYLNLNPRGEPQFGRRGVYNVLSDSRDTLAMLWLLNFSDGEFSLKDISEFSSIPIERLSNVAEILVAREMLKKLSP